ncbi:TSUP family transporter [Thalassobius vesicularis]
MEDFLVFLIVGFIAQIADGALGMGFGVISSAVLLFQGFAPPLVSASVNAAKIPTGLAAGLSHGLQGNIDWRVARALVIGGVLGGLSGAVILSGLKSPWLNGLVSLYLVILGVLILIRAIRGRPPRLIASRRLGLIGAAGGLMEGIGGSWGPVVTSALLGVGLEPRRAIGSSALAELAVSASVFVTLLLMLWHGHWGEAEAGALQTLAPLAGLVCGALPAAFLGGRLAARAPRRILTFGVGAMALGIGLYRGLPLFF